MKIKICFGLILIAFSLFCWRPNLVWTLAQETSQPSSTEDLSAKKSELEKKIEEYERELANKKEAIKTLNSQIAYMNSQVELTTLKISQTANEIEILELQISDLSKKISALNISLNETAVLFISRVVATYKAGKTSSLDLLLSAKDFSDFFRKTRYLKTVQTHDRQMMMAMEEIRLTYDNQRQKKEEKQKELEQMKAKLAKQKVELSQQKKDKEYLLVVTRNDEKNYQQMIAEALAELQAIQAIVAGRGEEKEMGAVKEGEKIATIISGVSPCSTGTHLHFEVRDGDTAKNPAEYLRQISVAWDNNPDGPFSFSGSWSWPINEPVEVTQGYGYTFYARVQRYYGGNPHTGIDIVSNDPTVKAVSEGTLYNGSVKCGSGYLRYIRLKHKDSNFSTYYLHINYEKL